MTVARTAEVQAGAFGIQDQSTYWEGSAFAGAAAGGTPSSMFWNPATMTQNAGLSADISFTGIIPWATNTVTSGTLAALGGTNNMANSAFVPSGAATWQLTQNLWVGVSLNAPFGLSTDFPNAWAGRDYALSSDLRTYNASPSVAVKLNDWISIGVGAQIQYAIQDLQTGLSAVSLSEFADAHGNGWGYGATAGVTLTPTPDTKLGLGWRSAINQDINATLITSPVVLPPISGSTLGAVTSTLKLPDMVTGSFSQRLSNQFTLLGTVEWTDWSRIGTSTALQPSGAPATILGVPFSVPFQYKDGWFFSLGGEYRYDARLLLRGGVAYEISPVTDQVRTPEVPDTNRVWLSLGASYLVAPNLNLDVGYSHIFMQDAPINITATSGNPFYNGVTSYTGTVSPHIDILTLGLRYQWYQPETKPLITKG